MPDVAPDGRLVDKDYFHPNSDFGLKRAAGNTQAASRFEHGRASIHREEDDIGLGLCRNGPLAFRKMGAFTDTMREVANATSPAKTSTRRIAPYT